MSAEIHQCTFQIYQKIYNYERTNQIGGFASIDTKNSFINGHILNFMNVEEQSDFYLKLSLLNKIPG